MSTEWREADATDVGAATAAVDGAEVIYQCLNAAYTAWPERFPPLQRGVLAAARGSDALLVSLVNVYRYGPSNGVEMTETLPLEPTTIKGRTRAAMTAELLAASDAGEVRIAIGRAPGFFAPGVTESALGERVFDKALIHGRADFLGNTDLLHTYGFTADIAAGLATLGTDERAVGGIWHLPGPETRTTRAVIDLIAEEVGQPVGIRSMPRVLLRALGLVNPMVRSLNEMAYQFEEPFVLDTSKFESTRTAPTSRAWRESIIGAVLIIGNVVTAPLRRHATNRWGATQAETTAAMPGDELVPAPRMRSTRELRHAAPPQPTAPLIAGERIVGELAVRSGAASPRRTRGDVGPWSRRRPSESLGAVRTQLEMPHDELR